MPASKRAVARALEEDHRRAVYNHEEAKENLVQGGGPLAEKGYLVVYCRSPFKEAVWRAAVVEDEEEGFVTAVKHLDGSVLDLLYKPARFRVAPRERFTVPLEQVLEAVGDCTDFNEIHEIVKPFFKFSSISDDS